MNLRQIKIHDHNTLAPEYILRDDQIPADWIVVDDAVAVQRLHPGSASFLKRRQACKGALQGTGACRKFAGGRTKLGDRCAQLDKLGEEDDWCEGGGAGNLPYSVKIGDVSSLECLTGIVDRDLLGEEFRGVTVREQLGENETGMAIDVDGQHRNSVGDDLYDFELNRHSEGYDVPQIVIEGTMFIAHTRAGAGGIAEVRVR